MPVQPLLPTLAFIYAGQAVAASVFVPLKTEKFYDLCGSLGFLSALAFSLRTTPLTPSASASASLTSTTHVGLGAKLWNVIGSAHSNPATTHWTGKLIMNRHPRQLIASALVAFWAARLGTFLFQRIQKSGKDSRFDEIKQSPTKFFGAWMMQATWISLTALPVFMVREPLGVTALPSYISPLSLVPSRHHLSAQRPTCPIPARTGSLGPGRFDRVGSGMGSRSYCGPDKVAVESRKG